MVTALLFITFKTQTQLNHATVIAEILEDS